MKQILTATIFTFVSAFGFANSISGQLQNIEKISGELSLLREKLDETIQDKEKRTTTFLVSTVAAAVLGLTTATVSSRTSSNIGQGAVNGIMTNVATGLTVIAVSVAGYSGFQVVMDIRAIPEFQKDINLKISQLEEAKAVLLNAK